MAPDRYGYCGASSAYCGSGCNPAFGSCSSSAASSPASKTRSIAKLTSTTATAASSATNASGRRISTNSRCGNAYEASPLGMTCVGSKWGNCCSQYSYCGSTDAYCGSGCQPGFGDCKPLSSSPSSTPAKAPIVPSSVLSATSASSGYPASSSTTTIESVGITSSSTSATSPSSSPSEVESSSSSGAILDLTVTPPVVSAPSEIPNMSTSSLAASETSTSTEAVISSSSISAGSSESLAISAELPNTAAAPLPTSSETGPAEVEIVSSAAPAIVSKTPNEPTTTPMPSSTEVPALSSETETETIFLSATPMTSTFTSSGSESSSEPTSTPTPELASSSVVETILPLSETPTEVPMSSVVASSTASAPTTCNTLAASYNPSFESGAIAPWTFTGMNPIYGKTEVLSAASAPFAPLDGSSALYTTTTDRSYTNFAWLYTLKNVYIPANSNFNCTVGIKLMLKDNRIYPGIINARLFVDNQLVNWGPNNVFIPSQPSTLENWRRIGGPAVATAQDMHTISINIFSNANSVFLSGMTIAIDDLQCFPTGQCAI
ncbi:carbohydrate esterase family 4 protein [Stemphylium lycopersici]|uniref:Carbohydrate esterase family 4 protein n=1 Tax=Stemphylium lycopersici TaxID=183478 RepID=A0A364N116_STELY|nr:carbohydrate esterase family 4 protein [Stemphylium lycopersici]